MHRVGMLIAPMNTTSLQRLATAALAALLVSSTIGVASASPILPKPTGSFARFTAVYADPREPGVDVGWGAFVAVGARFSDGEASAEVGQLRFDQSETLDLGDYVVVGSADLRITSALVGGRYGVRLGKSDRVRLMLGGMVGFAHVAFSGSATDGEDTLALKTSSTGAAWAGDLGLVVGLSEKIELSIGYRYMGIDGTSWEAYGYELEIPHQTANIYHLGLAYRW